MDKVAEDPSRKNVHELRILIRRLLADGWLVNIKKPRALKKLNGILGVSRQLDVGIKDARRAGLDVRKIKRNRKHAKRRLERFLQSKRKIKKMKSLASAMAKTKDASGVENREAKLRRRLKSCLAKMPKKKKDLHRFRIEVKKMRYALEALGGDVEKLKQLQAHLGRLHDMEILEKMAGKKTGYSTKTAAQEMALAKSLIRRSPPLPVEFIMII